MLFFHGTPRLPGTPRFHILLVESVLHLVEHPDSGLQRARFLRQAALRPPQFFQFPEPLLLLLPQSLNRSQALLLFLPVLLLQRFIIQPKPTAKSHPLRLQILFLLPEKIQALLLPAKFLPAFLHIPLLLSAGQHMKPVGNLVPPALQSLFFHPQHLQIAPGKPLPVGDFVILAGKLLVFQPMQFLSQPVHLTLHHLRLFPLLPLQAMQPADEIPYAGSLACKLRRHVPITESMLPHPLRLLAKGADGVPALDFRPVVLVLAGIFFHNALEFFHPVLVLVQLVLHGIQEPFLHQAFLIPAVGEQIRQAGLFQIDFLDDGLPFLIINLVLRQLVEILLGLGRIVHVIVKERNAALPFISLEKLFAGGKAFQRDILFRLLHHGKMMDVLLASCFVFRYKIDDFQFILGMSLSHAFLQNLLAPADHHPGQHVASPLVQLPFHQNERGLVGGKIAGKRAVLGILVPPVDERRHHHLHQNGLSSAVSQRQEGALPMQLKGLVADADGIVVIIQINQTDCVYLAHINLHAALPRHKEMPPNNLRKPVAKFTDFIRFTLNKMRRLFSGSS